MMLMAPVSEVTVEPSTSALKLFWTFTVPTAAPTPTVPPSAKPPATTTMTD